MEKQLSFVFMLSLKEISLRRVVINLFNERDILPSIAKFCSLAYSDAWRKSVECKVIDKLSKLVIPKVLEKQALYIVTPIGLEIKRWKAFHDSYLAPDIGEFRKPFIRIELDAPILSKLCWTTFGTVDYRKTAEELVRCEMLDILFCYQLACLYCLEDCIPLLWEELPEWNKRYFYNSAWTSPIKMVNLQFCWPYILKGEQSKLDSMIEQVYGKNISFNHLAFEFSANRGNKAATKYFFQKLTCEEKETALYTTAEFVAKNLSSDRLIYSDDTFPFENCSDALFYLISLMNYEEQMKSFYIRPVELLIFFLEWRWHDLFLKIADLTWTFLPAQSYGYLLKNLSAYFTNQKYYFPFLNLFQEFFRCSPINFRKEFVDRECRLGDFFPRLFNIQDSDTIKVIFRNVEASDRVRLVSCKPVFKLFSNFIFYEKWDTVKLCLREASLSNEDRERLTDAFLAFRTADGQKIKRCKFIRKPFLKMMDEIYGNGQRKRSSGEDALNNAKKVHFSDTENCANELK